MWCYIGSGGGSVGGGGGSYAWRLCVVKVVNVCILFDLVVERVRLGVEQIH